MSDGTPGVRGPVATSLRQSLRGANRWVSRPGRAAVWRFVACASLAVGVAAPTAAAPLLPASDDTVIERLSAHHAVHRTARQAARAAPERLPLALQRAQAGIDEARRSGDPRAVGEAEAALAPWWHQAEAPASVRLLRATIRQHLHEFDAALADLDGLIDTSTGFERAAKTAPTAPQTAQALLTRSALHLLQGRPERALADCLQLATLDRAIPGVAWHAAVCRAEVLSRSGALDDAARRFAALAVSPPAGQAAWLAVLRGELAARRGDDAAAERELRAAVAAAPDVYNRSALVDQLLATRQPREALAVLDAARTPATEEIDALLLRRALALKALGPQATGDELVVLARTTDRVAEQFRVARWRGDLPHWREEARFELLVREQPLTALALAQTNWATQREPIDAWLLAAAARAAQQPAALEPLRRFMAETGYRDHRLDVWLAPDALTVGAAR